ncbi:MAG: GMC family oxidoreductase N-terminal domain-containing protein, partial [Chloroflexi bacterium]|nr:GMC family oxidoreductase N-terminal domain-containing protein [Chloroflexota bacterium]
FRKMENDRDFPGGDFHGNEGPLPVRRYRREDWLPINRGFYDACVAVGFPEDPDENSPDSDGVGAQPLNNIDGVRMSTALTYINPNRHRVNLTIRANVQATRILFTGNWATAVQVERCFKAGALALGAEVEITSVPGYMALVNDPVMGDLFAANVDALSGPGTALRRGAAANRGGSTDMGDLSQIMPVIHPYVNAATGTAHGVDYLIEDYYSAVVTSASALAMTVIDLLAADAANAKTVLKEAKPPMTRVQYVSAQRARMRVTRYKGR